VTVAQAYVAVPDADASAPSSSYVANLMHLAAKIGVPNAHMVILAKYMPAPFSGEAGQHDELPPKLPPDGTLQGATRQYERGGRRAEKAVKPYRKLLATTGQYALGRISRPVP